MEENETMFIQCGELMEGKWKYEADYYLYSSVGPVFAA